MRSGGSSRSERSEGSERSGAPGESGGAVVAPVRLGTGRWSRWIAVAGGLGYVPIAPGTAGSLGGVLLFLLALNVATGISRASFLVLYALAVGSLLLLGIRAAGRAEVDFGRRDDGRIVIDEVVGQLIALTPLVPLARDDLFLLFPEVVTGFVLFRLFDVWKPGAIRWAERRFEGGLGVMADDVVAGIYAGFCLFVLHLLVFERFFSSSVALVERVEWVALKVSA
jgi:phosphatidylglycerophosphatase A